MVGDLCGVQRGQIHRPENSVLGGQRGLHFGAQLLRVEEILDAQADAVHLVRVGGADAPPGGADEVVAARPLVGLVHEAVVRGDDVRAGGQQQARAVDAPRLHLLDLAEEDVEVDDDPRGDDGGDPLGEDARGQQVQGVLLAVHYDGVAGVVAAVELDDVVSALTDLVGRLAFALVAPLGAEHDHGGHRFSKYGRVRWAEAAAPPSLAVDQDTEADARRPGASGRTKRPRCGGV